MDDGVDRRPGVGQLAGDAREAGDPVSIAFQTASDPDESCSEAVDFPLPYQRIKNRSTKEAEEMALLP